MGMRCDSLDELLGWSAPLYALLKLRASLVRQVVDCARLGDHGEHRLEPRLRAMGALTSTHACG